MRACTTGSQTVYRSELSSFKVFLSIRDKTKLCDSVELCIIMTLHMLQYPVDAEWLRVRLTHQRKCMRFFSFSERCILTTNSKGMVDCSFVLSIFIQYKVWKSTLQSTKQNSGPLCNLAGFPKVHDGPGWVNRLS